MNMPHELKVTTSTIHKDQSTVMMSFKHLHTRTRRERAKRAHSWPCNYYNKNVVRVWALIVEPPNRGHVGMYSVDSAVFVVCRVVVLF